MIDRAVESAPSGATIRIGPGIYFEFPITLDQTLVLEGAGAQGSSVQSPGTKIVLREPGEPRASDVPLVGITVLGNQALSVELRGFRLETPAHFDEGIKVFSRTAEEMEVILRDLYIESQLGVSGQALQVGGLKARGPSIIVESSTLVTKVGIGMESGRLVLRNSLLQAPENLSSWSEELQFPPIGVLLVPGLFLNPLPPVEFPPSVFLPITVEAILEGSRIRGFSVGVAAGAIGPMNLDVQLIGNEITSNEDGISLSGDRLTVNLMNNEIYGNRRYGVWLALPGCPLGSTSNDFQGTVQGSGNRIYDNGVLDLCPADYPWPEGFTAP